MTPSEARTVRLGLVVIGMALFGLRGVPMTARAVREHWSEVDAKLLMRSRLEQRIRELPHLENSARTIRAEAVGLAPALLAGGVPTEAERDLAARLHEFAVDAGVALDGTRSLSDSARAGILRHSSTEVTLQADTRGLVRFLTLLSTGPVVLDVSEIEVNALNPEGGADAPERLTVRLQLGGWFMPDRPK